MTLLFVYGSLKEGFPNYPHNRGTRLPGAFRTVQPHPFYLADGSLPCLLDEPGSGLPVIGQLFEVGDAELQALDRLERVGEPGGYRRVELAVQAAAQAAVQSDAQTATQPAEAPVVLAQAYVQDRARLTQGGPHVGPIAEYTPEHARRLSW
ncbi:MAG: gamma-glutamylcyclotransferase family protein [Rubrivivax sp.]